MPAQPPPSNPNAYNLTPLFSPPDAPFWAMRTFPVPAGLLESEWSFIQNLRGEAGFELITRYGIRIMGSSLMCRWGALAFATSGGVHPLPGGAIFRGLNLTPYGPLTFNPFIAFDAGGSVKLYALPVTTPGNYALNELDVFGNPVEFPSGLYVWGSAARDPFPDATVPLTAVVADDATPYVGDISIGDEMIQSRHITPPSGTSQFSVNYGLKQPLNIANHTGTTFTNSGAHLVAAYPALTSPQPISVAFDSSVALNDTAQINYATPVDLTGARSLAMLHFRSTDWDPTWLYDFWDEIKLEIKYGVSSYITIWDPNSTTSQRLNWVIPANGAGSPVYLQAFPLDQIDPSLLTAVNGLRFTYVGTNASSITGADHAGILITCMGSTGNVPGGCSYGISYCNQKSRAESGGIVLPINVGTNISQMQGGYGYGGDMQFPLVEGMFYYATTHPQNTDSTQLSYGVDRIRIFRRDPLPIPYTYPEFNPDDYLFAQDVQVAHLTGGAYVFNSGSALSVLAIVDNTDPSNLNPNLKLPSSFNREMPSGAGIAFINGRMAVWGGEEADAVWLSDQVCPFRFSDFIRYQGGAPVSSSSLKISLDGEAIMNIVAQPGADEVGGAMLIFTTRSIYRVSGIDALSLSLPQLVSRTGTTQPWSVCAAKDAVVYLSSDSKFNMITLDGGIECISNGKVEDQIAQIKFVDAYRTACGFWNDRFYFSYDVTGGTNPSKTKCLVYDERLTGWVSIDQYPGTYEQFQSVWNGYDNYAGLYVAATNTKTYVYEVHGQTTDDGTAITVAGASRELVSTAMETNMGARRSGWLVDSCPGCTMTVTRQFFTPDSTAVGSFSMDGGSDARKFSWDSDSLDGVGGEGSSVQLSFTGQMPGGKQIRNIALETKDARGGRVTR